MPRFPVALPDGSAVYMPDHGHTVSVIDTSTNTVIADIRVGDLVGEDPEYPVVLPDGSAVYVPKYRGDTVSVINPRTKEVTSTIKAGWSPRRPGVLPDGSAVYVPNFDDDTVSVISL
jgi:YVTN family beta-propeller protein